MSLSKQWVLLVLLACVAGCAKVPTEPLSIVSSPWPGYEPLYLSRDLGYLKNTAVRITELPSSNITLEAFSNGSADVATLTLDEAVTLLARGVRLRILVVMDVSNGADAVIARPGIDSLVQLKGKRLGMENIPLGVYMLSRVLERAGLTASDVEVIPMPEDRHEKAYLQGKVDALVTMEPNKTRLVHEGARVLFDSSRIPDEIFDVLVVREATYRTRRGELCELARQWFRTLDYVQVHPQDAVRRMSRRMGVDEATFRASLAGIKVPSRQENQHLLGGVTPALLAPASRMIAIMRRARMIPASVDIAATLDPAFERCLRP